MFCLSFLTSSAPVIHTLTHKHTHIFTAAHSSFLAAVQHYGEKLNLNADICHMHLAADVEVTPMFRRHFFFFFTPGPNQVTVNFPAVSEQAGDEARPNRTDGWALFAFCCYLFMCLFFLSLSPLIQRPLILSCPSPRCQRGNTVSLHQV